MITEDDRREIEAAAARVPVRRAAAVEALQVIQKRNGWVSDEDLRAAAGLLGMTVTETRRPGVVLFHDLPQAGRPACHPLLRQHLLLDPGI